jgi:mRNA-degrading endonuclease RelE of RelBE toxin-antitoxin system
VTAAQAAIDAMLARNLLGQGVEVHRARRRALTSRRVMAIIMVIMPRRQAYTLAFASEVTKHLRAIDTKYHALIREKISEQLRFAPTTETTNRKPLRRPPRFGATWEIRFGPDNRFRVLYDIDPEARVVQIMAIGEKQRERPFIGGEEVQL